MELNYYNFVNSETLDYRSDFANAICKLIYQKNNGDIDASAKEFAKFDGYLSEYVRNIYEVISDEIPLWAYYKLINGDASDYDLNQEEYVEAKRRCVEACKVFYS